MSIISTGHQDQMNKVNWVISIRRSISSDSSFLWFETCPQCWNYSSMKIHASINTEQTVRYSCLQNISNPHNMSYLKRWLLNQTWVQKEKKKRKLCKQKIIKKKKSKCHLCIFTFMQSGDWKMMFQSRENLHASAELLIRWCTNV